MLVVDLMHEFELGVWKALFIHLLRILESHDRGNLTTKLDRRYSVFSSSIVQKSNQGFKLQTSTFLWKGLHPSVLGELF
jgi:hypothetical protein